ncbi:MAG: major capsid protein [Candidatus Thorarchaeota archaeon]
MNPTQHDVHINGPLTNISVAYMQDRAGFVADQVFPNIPVAKQSDLYWAYDAGYFNRDEMEKRADATESAGGHYKVTTDNYFAEVWAFHHDIGDQRRANSDAPLQPDREATELVSMKALLKREVLWASTYFATSVWTLDKEGVAAGPTGDQFLQWNDAASTPLEDFRAARTAQMLLTGFRPNTLVLGPEVYDALLDHPDIIDRVKYGQTPGRPADIGTEDLSQLFKIPNVYVMEGIKNTAAEGAAASNAFIGGKSALLCYSAPSPGLMTPTAGYTFSWTGLLGAGAMGGRIAKMRMDLKKADRIEIEMAMVQKKVSADMGTFFYTAVA